MYSNSRRCNPQNGLPEPLGTIVILFNFGLGVYNAYSNRRQERFQTVYQRRQEEIHSILEEVKAKIENGT